MTLKDYYEKVPRGQKKKFRKEVAKVCFVTELNVYKWINGEYRPDELKKRALSKLVEIPVEELFPTVEHEV
jgi:DNA-binding XRE family transcriptional regulator